MIMTLQRHTVLPKSLLNTLYGLVAFDEDGYPVEEEWGGGYEDETEDEDEDDEDLDFPDEDEEDDFDFE